MAKGKETPPEYYARLLDMLSDEPSEEAVEQMASVDSTIQAIIGGQTVEQVRREQKREKVRQSQRNRRSYDLSPIIIDKIDSLARAWRCPKSDVIQFAIQHLVEDVEANGLQPEFEVEVTRRRIKVRKNPDGMPGHQNKFG